VSHHHWHGGDCIADYAAPVPAEAGRFVREQVLSVQEQWQVLQQLQQLQHTQPRRWQTLAIVMLMGLIFLIGIALGGFLMRWLG